MKTKHRTKDGKELYISEMDESHLEATIRLMLKKINEAKEMLYANIKENKFKSALYGTKQVSESSLKDFISHYSLSLPVYIMEASIRGISFSTELQSVFERSTKDSVSNSQLLLPESVEDFDDYDYGDEDLY